VGLLRLHHDCQEERGRVLLASGAYSPADDAARHGV
jgi:hypothetical protein